MEVHLILVNIDKEKSVIFKCDNSNWPNEDPKCFNADINLHDLGGEERQEEMKHMYTRGDEDKMIPYDFSGMKICNSYVAQNSRFFCVGLVGKFDTNSLVDEHHRKNDKRSVMGVFRVDLKTLGTSVEAWINQYPFQDFFVDDNMTTVMFLSRSGRRLDYHFLLWDFDTESMESNEYRDLLTLDAGHIPGYDDKEDG